MRVAAAQVHKAPTYDRDVVTFEEDAAICHQLELPCQAHDFLGGFLRHIQANSALIHPVTSRLWAAMLAVEARLIEASPGYRAPWVNKCVPLPGACIGLYSSPTND
jgi:hypothetical protein